MTEPAFKKGTTNVVHTASQAQAMVKALRYIGKQITFVPTMGALHAGHMTLVEQAQRIPGSVVVVSIFVNPLQFGEGEDLDQYPRTLEKDIELLTQTGVEMVFAPSVEDMYPSGGGTMIHPGPGGDILDGRSRPGHFAGMLTVVNKLFNIINPHHAFFGEKDYQQLTLIRQMVEDLNMTVKVHGIPTVREQDGLALSSRNRYLTKTQRESATALSAALAAAAHTAQHGREAIVEMARSILDAAEGVELEYVELYGADLQPAPERGEGRLLVAAKVGDTRLIDNVGVAIGTGFLAEAEQQVHEETQAMIKEIDGAQEAFERIAALSEEERQAAIADALAKSSEQ